MCFMPIHSNTPLIRFSGTIVGVEDISPHWVNSKWRSLKVFSSFTLKLFLLFLVIICFSYFVNLQVQWDEPAAVPRPDRVSPWEIEPFVASASTPSVQPTMVKTKRPRPPSETPDVGELLL